MNHPTPDSADNLDLQIDRTLAALGQIQPSPIFHDRLLGSLESSLARSVQATSTSSRYGVISTGGAPRRSGETPVFRPWHRGGWATAALAAAAILLLYLALHTHPSPPHPQQANAHPTSPTLAHATTPGAPSSTTASPSGKVVPQPPKPTTATNTHPTTPSTQPAIPVELSTSVPLDLDQQAVADLHAPSQPAPPLPPTEQERLVRLMLRRGEKRDLAELDHDKVNAFFTQERASFQNFFDPPVDPQVRAQLDGLTSPSSPATQPQGASK